MEICANLPFDSAQSRLAQGGRLPAPSERQRVEGRNLRPRLGLVVLLVTSAACASLPPTSRKAAVQSSTLFGRPDQSSDDREEPQITPDRPDVTNQTYTVPKALMQLETGASWGRVPVSGSIVSTPFSLRTGISHFAELRIDSSGFTRDKQLGDVSNDFSGVGLGGKVRLWGGQNAVFALEPLVTLPWGRGASGGTDYSLTLLVDRKLTSKIQASFNYGFSETAADSAHVPQHQLSVSADADIGTNWKPYVELYWLSSVDPARHRDLSIDAGATYLLNQRLAVDGGVLWGLAVADARPAAFAGLSVILGELTGRKGVRERLRDAQMRGDR